MATVVDRIQSNFNQDLAVKMAQGATVTALAHVVLGSARGVMALGAATAALCSVIDALARPVLDTIFPNHPTFRDASRVIIAVSTAVGVANAVAPWLGVAFQLTNLSVFLSLCLNGYLFSGENVKADRSFAYVL